MEGDNISDAMNNTNCSDKIRLEGDNIRDDMNNTDISDEIRLEGDNIRDTINNNSSHPTQVRLSWAVTIILSKSTVCVEM